MDNAVPKEKITNNTNLIIDCSVKKPTRIQIFNKKETSETVDGTKSDHLSNIDDDDNDDNDDNDDSDDSDDSDDDDNDKNSDINDNGKINIETETSESFNKNKIKISNKPKTIKIIKILRNMK